MANIKFSEFTGGASIVQADHFLVGFDTDATAGGSNPKNNKWTFPQVAPFTGIYAANGTIGTTRKALVTDTIQFRNSGDTLNLLTLNTNGSFGLGYNGVQITNSISGNESVRINDRSGAPLLKVGVSSGSAAAINMCNGYFNTFSYTTVGGMVYTNAGGVNSAQDPCSMFTLNSSSASPKGMLPPRLTTTLRDAINSGNFTTGTTIYNTTDNKLQFYNGTAWTDAVSVDSIYTADGTITTGRKALLAGTLQFRNAGDSSDILKLNTDGTFTLGLDAIAQGVSAVTIGQLAETTVSNSVAIGYNAEAAGGIAIGQNADNNQSYSQCIGGNTSNAAQYQTVIGYDADGLAGADRSIAIGASAKAAAQGGIAIGVGANAQDHCIVLGRNVGVSGTPDNSVVFATRGGNNITYSEANTFTWYNTSDTVPDLKIVGGGESTLRTSLKITGQAYTELHTGTTPADPNWNNGNIQEMTLASLDQDFDPANAKAGATYILKIKQPSSGAAGTINWNAASATVYWPSPGEPTLSTGNNQVDIVTLICTAGGVSGGTYYANATLNFS